MSYNTFPTFTGMTWDIKKRLLSSTQTETSSSGAEFRIGRWSLPHFEFDLTFEYLSQADFNTLQSFFIQQNGPLLPFLLDCVNNDNGLSAAPCGSGNGVLTSFQIPLPAQAQVTSTAALTVAGVTLPAAGCSTPATPTTSTVAGGTKAARTYFARVTYVDAAGGETPASAEKSQAVALNNLLTVTSPSATPGAVSWRLYLNTATNTEKLQVTTPIGTNYTEPTSALSFAGAAYPVADTSGWSVAATGLITFLAPVVNAAAIAWTGGYAYLVRFLDDELELNQLMNAMYEQEGLTLRTVR